jgi:hypothetical protein
MITIEDIKQNLGIDISKPNRKVVPVVLKAMYAEMVCNKLKLPIGIVLNKIGEDLNCKRSNIYNYQKKLKMFKTNKETKLIVKAFKTLDKKYIDEFFNLKRNQRKNYDQQFYSNSKPENDKIVEIKNDYIVKQKIQKKMNNLQVATFLKANNDYKSRNYWNVHLENYTLETWDSLRAINPKMFDSVVNN